jgi:hypothetical protein
LAVPFLKALAANLSLEQGLRRRNVIRLHSLHEEKAILERVIEQLSV